MKAESASFNDSLTAEQRKTRNRQLGRIHCMARELGWVGSNKDLLRMQVQIATGRDSMSDLGIAQLGLVLDRLKSCLGTHRGKQTRSETQSGSVIQLPTPGQRELASELLEALRLPLGIRDTQKYLAGVAQKACGKPLDRLNRLEFGQILEALKKIRSRF